MKVLITTSGVGSRLGEFTRYTNKALVPIGDSAAISRVIACYPSNTEFFITLGHYGNQVKDFLNIAYPEYSFTFLWVDLYQGKGSSLGFSILHAREYLKSPFIFHASDSLINCEITSSPKHNWIGGHKGGDASQYTSFDCIQGKVVRTHEKGMDSFDFVHTGVLGIYSHDVFWKTLEDLYNFNPNDETLSDIDVVTRMLAKGEVFINKEFSEWEDVGSTKGLHAARQSASNILDTLEKVDESIYKVDGKVIKFFSNVQVCESRVKRASILAPFVPSVISSSENFYAYNFVEGKPLSYALNPHTFKELLTWGLNAFWSRKDTLTSDEEFFQLCRYFYFDKTLDRVGKFFEKSGFEDKSRHINGEYIPTALEILEKLRSKKLDQGIQGVIHGDFILDNLLITDNGFLALDWRQDFAGLITSGDIYYDLAKLNHSLTMNHSLLNANSFTLKYEGEDIYVDILRRDSFVQCMQEIEIFCRENDMDYDRVRILTGIVWLNMAALHPHPMDIFLFNYGKLQIWRSLNE